MVPLLRKEKAKDEEKAGEWFSNDIFKDCPKLTVYGEAGTGIERYCEENGYAFKAISDISEMK